MEKPIPSLKRFGAWVTDLTDRYRFNPFFQATVHIVTIQLLLVLLLIAITGWAIQYAQTNTVGSITYHLELAHNGGPAAHLTLPQAIATVRARTLTYVFICLVVLITLFGLLLIRFALSPTKNSVQFQKRFIGNVAHEIRTPLAIIKTSTEVALMDPALPQAQADMLGETLLQLNRVSETINNLLSFNAFLQPNRMKMEVVDLGKIAEIVIERHQPLASSRTIELSLNIYGKHMVTGNSTALEQVVTNLLTNALNYTPAESGGKVRVKIENDYRGYVVLTVSDTGMGIAQKDLYHIFEPYYRSDTSRARGAGRGTSGIGLTIVNEIVRFHHGTINIKSALGSGTSIAVAFPPAQITAADENKLLPTEDDSDMTVNEISIDFS